MNNEEKERLYARRERREHNKIQKQEEMDRLGIDYERLTEFFFDLCLSWCQYLDVETFLFFINGVFLNITKGNHINVSIFKPLSEVEVLSIEFINHLLAYRSLCQEKMQSAQSYGQWYTHNFSRTHMIVSNVEKNLQEAFKERNENRILDIWVDLPPQIINKFVHQHFEKMDKDFVKMDYAMKSTQKLQMSIQAMDQLKKLTVTKPAPSLIQKIYQTQSPPSFFRDSKVPKQRTVNIKNDKIDEQRLIE